MAKEFPGAHDAIVRNADKRYLQVSKDTEFSKNSSNPLDKRLDLTAYFLATIQTLEEKQTEFQRIKKVCTEIALDYVKPKNRFQKSLKKLPPKFANTKLFSLFLKMMDKKLSKKGHQDGFLAKIITDKNETFGFGYGIDILECGICKLFHKHGAQKYAPILCEVDKITSGLAGLELIRKGTIADGADKCDFRFKKK